MMNIILHFIQRRAFNYLQSLKKKESHRDLLNKIIFLQNQRLPYNYAKCTFANKHLDGRKPKLGKLQCNLISV